MRKIFWGLALFFFTSCKGNPVGWGGSHEIIIGNKEAITFRYDPWLVDYDGMYKDADAHCKTFGKNPVETNKGRQREFGTQSFDCR